MNIIVLVKQVPDTTEIKIDKVTNTLIRVGVPNIVNPDDLAGVEEALKLKEKYGGKVTVVTMGPPQAEGMLKELYARGIDKAYLLTDPKFAGSDTWATSKILSSFISTLKFDLIIAGYQAIDGDTAQVGPQVAAFLNIPQVTHVSKMIGVDSRELIVEKKYENEVVVLGVELPALITSLKTMNSPRNMNAFDIWNLDDKEVVKIVFSDLKIDPNEIGLLGSPTRVKTTYTKALVSKAPSEKLEPEEAAKRIVSLLKPYIKEEK